MKNSRNTRQRKDRLYQSGPFFASGIFWRIFVRRGYLVFHVSKEYAKIEQNKCLYFVRVIKRRRNREASGEMKRETLRKRKHRHKMRLRGIMVFGLAVMLSFTVEYITGGPARIQHTLDMFQNGIRETALEGIERLEAVLEQGEGRAEEAQKTVRAVDGILMVHFLDVGQADCILIQEGSEAMLIDAGNQENGEEIVEYIRAQGIERLEYVIGTHPHADHIGGLAAVLEELNAGEVLLPGKAQTTAVYEELLDVIEEKAFPVTLAEPGLSYTLGDAVVSVIAPVKDYGEELNNWSVGIRLVFGRNSFVFTGDAQEEAEKDMVESNVVLRADVWKAAHHGSDTSNSAAMLDAVSPSFAVISCGKNNSYGHPNASVLEAFRQRGIQVFRTDEQGTVIAWSDGTNITWSCEPYGL